MIKSPIFALVDCNSFYCSCERVFRPDLLDQPVVVLSNNDGCIVSRTDEVKAVGIPAWTPYFKVKDLLKKHRVHVFSSNYTLYGDMSGRVMQTLAEFAPEIEIYSIDEAFLNFTGMESFQIFTYSQHIRKVLLRNTGIPTCIGIGPTKVLAKVANRFAKKNKRQTGGVTDLRDLDLKEHILRGFPVEDIWGVGEQSAKKLRGYNIKTAWQLMNSDLQLIRKILTVVGARIVQELRGVSCLNLKTDLEDPKQIISSGSFGHPVVSMIQLEEAIAEHVSIACEKLRKKNLKCKYISLFIQTNPFSKNEHYYNHSSTELAVGTSVTPKLIKEANLLLKKIYQSHFEYKKCGVILGDFYQSTFQQLDFFHSYDTAKEDHFMQTIDAINQFHGRGTVKYASCGVSHMWRRLSQMKSPCYTTRWSELPVAR